MVKKEEVKEFVMNAFKKQFELVGYGDMDTKELLTLGKKPENYLWKDIMSITPLQKEEFKLWFITRAGKDLRISHRIAEREFDAFYAEFGLRVTGDENT